MSSKPFKPMLADRNAVMPVSKRPYFTVAEGHRNGEWPQGEFKGLNPRECWELWERSNQNAYGKRTLEYADTVATIAENKLARGESFDEAMRVATEIANSDGITGHMHHFALRILQTCWVHGGLIDTTKH